MIDSTSHFHQLIAGGRTLASTLFAEGSTARLGQVIEREFDGCNLFAAARLIGIRKFRKGFWTTPEGIAMGYNIPVRQNGLDQEWLPKPDAQHPRHFGYYRVQPVASEAEHPVGNALLLDYGQGQNPWWNFTWVLRDYLRQPFADDPDVLLGAAYVKIGALRFFSNFFALRWIGATTRKGSR